MTTKQSKILNVRDGVVTAVFLPGEPMSLNYGMAVEVDSAVEVGVGDVWPAVKVEKAKK